MKYLLLVILSSTCFAKSTPTPTPSPTPIVSPTPTVVPVVISESKQMSLQNAIQHSLTTGRPFRRTSWDKNSKRPPWIYIKLNACGTNLWRLRVFGIEDVLATDWEFKE